ncbi:MAG: peroxiredoxin [Alphaproteobacteria bacterium]|nr:peroxiredoxin [Alphaproteobacteria bacterium]
MPIQTGDRIPAATLFEMTADGPRDLLTSELFAGKTVVLFGVPGAYTPTCTHLHLPGFIKLADRFKERGVDDIVCFAVNDPFVMAAWGKVSGATGKVRMVSDGNGELTAEMGLDVDLSSAGLGVRSRRFAMVVVDGVVTSLDIEQPGKFEVSGAEIQLSKL